MNERYSSNAEINWVKAKLVVQLKHVAHCIYRLGAHVPKVHTLIEAALRLNEIQKIHSFKTVSSKIDFVPNVSALEDEGNFEDIFWRSFHRAVSSRPELRHFNTRCQHGLAKLLTKARDGEKHNNFGRYRKGMRNPDVHAEASLAHFLLRQKASFAGGDNFIGCSKPSCYTCHLTLTSHPQAYFPTAQHNVCFPTCPPWPPTDAQTVENWNGINASSFTEDIKQNSTRMTNKLAIQIVRHVYRHSATSSSANGSPGYCSSNGSTPARSSASTDYQSHTVFSPRTPADENAERILNMSTLFEPLDKNLVRREFTERKRSIGTAERYHTRLARKLSLTREQFDCDGPNGGSVRTRKNSLDGEWVVTGCEGRTMRLRKGLGGQLSVLG
jgi:hypothetical protein